MWSVGRRSSSFQMKIKTTLHSSSVAGSNSSMFRQAVETVFLFVSLCVLVLLSSYRDSNFGVTFSKAPLIQNSILECSFVLQLRTSQRYDPSACYREHPSCPRHILMLTYSVKHLCTLLDCGLQCEITRVKFSPCSSVLPYEKCYRK